jgi:CRISPR-associated protein Cmr2
LSDSNRVHLSFSVGPVQTFVAQARRTRDLWAGSWLLSYLAETALAAAERADGDPIIPYRTPQQRGKITSRATPVGGYPNRFELAFGDPVAAKLGAEQASQAFREAWSDITKAVWDKFVMPVEHQGNGTNSIWKRQIDNFWELSWVIGAPDAGAQTLGRLAAARKNFRNVSVAAEPGTKCSLMGTMQEISGHFGPGQWKAQAEFWKALQGSLDELDLKVGERLCAIALVKRLFPKVIQSAVAGTSPDLFEQRSWPSTAFIAVRPWLEKLQGSNPHAAEEYARSATRLGYSQSETQAAREVGIPWAAVDAPVWFASAVKQNEPKLKQEDVRLLLERLRIVSEAAGSTKPVPYYALLLMDGDSVGSLPGLLGSSTELSAALARFSEFVPSIIKSGGGRTVYAGGDDVLALVPAVSALETAHQLCDSYRKSFAGTGAQESATISGAIVFAHWRHPLRQVLRTAHQLLDEVAKDQTGRDSLAIGIIAGSGLNTVWSAPWAAIRGEAPGSVKLGSAIADFGAAEQDDESPCFNASYLYRLREDFSRLFDKPMEQPGSFGNVPVGGEDLLVELAHAEYRRRLKTGERQETPPEETRPRIEALMSLSQRWTRSQPNGSFSVSAARQIFGFDGWRVARFMKQVQQGKVDDHE